MIALLKAVPPLAWALALTGLLLGVQTLRLSGEKADHANTRAEHAELVAEAERLTREAVEAARSEESRRFTALQRITDDTEDALAQARADAAAAGFAAARLQERLATVARAASSCARNSVTPGERKAADTAAGVLADVQRRLDATADGIAGFADRAHVAGLACERSYDALTP